MKGKELFAAFLIVATLPACQPDDRQAGVAAAEEAGGAAGAGSVADDAPADPLDPGAEARFRAAMDERLAEIDSAVQELPGLIGSIRQDMRRHLNDAHVATARRNGVGPVRDSAHVAELVRSGDLIELPDSTAWWVLRELDQSLPYVTPGTRAALEDIGRRFHARLDEHDLPPFRLDVTSVLRTGEQQAALRRRNANAAETTSSHQFGTTFDIAYLSFAAPDSLGHPSLATGAGEPVPHPLRADLTTRLDTLGTRHAPHLEGELGAVLQEMQRDGHVLPLRERSQPVYHITVARDPR